MCKTLCVSRSGYYEWLERPDSKNKEANINLLKEIKRVYDRSRGFYGRIKITKKLNNEGIKCSQNRVYRLMKENNIFSKMKRKFKATTNSKHNHPVVPNLLNQDFTANKPSQKWVSDITYIATNEGWLYLAAVLDLHDKKIIGWAMDSTMTQ
jgi:transposase InsO family protein